MASWLSRSGSQGAQSPPPKPVPPPSKTKKRERWLLTRKTWRYMADAGKLLIPESMRKGKDIKEYTPEDLARLEEHFHNVCDQQQDFIEWEGPRQDPRVMLAHNRSPRTETDGIPKFRLVLPVGQEPPPGYVQVGTRSLPMGDLHDGDDVGQDSYLKLPSGLLLQELPAAYLGERDWYARRSSSPSDSGVLSPGDWNDDDQFDQRHTESGIGSGVDSVGGKQRARFRSIKIQTEPLPDEFYRLLEEEKRREEEERRRREEEERLAREAEERRLRELEEAEANMMGDSVMRYLKMVRRNSKSSDQKKAERFRSMNYDPTLRNIKAKYLMKEELIEGYKKSTEIQVGESLLALLKQCKAEVDPAPYPPKKKSSRKYSSDFSDCVVSSPRRRYSIAEPLLPPGNDVEKDFFSHLYSGDMTSMESGSVPEDYYSYLESWYRAQKGLHQSNSITKAGSSSSTSIYIPVNALQNLRASMPTLATFASVTSVPSVSRSTSSLGKSPGQSFLSSVISSKPFSGLGNFGGSASGLPGGNTSVTSSRIISKKLWRPRSKSQGRSGYSSWKPTGDYHWYHVSNRHICLESTHLLLLHDFERVALQKVAGQKLNCSDLGITIRIPKDNSDKPKRRGYFKKVLPRAGKDKSREHLGPAPVFGVPLNQCVDPIPWRKRSLVTSPCGQPALSPEESAKYHRADDSSKSEPMKDSRCSESVSSPVATMTSATSFDSLNLIDLRRMSTSRSSQSSSFDALAAFEDDGVGIASPSNSSTCPCVPPVVMMCIRHLEQFGLHTVGIFRVSSSKRRVKQLRDQFDSGGEITLSVDTGVHDVATILKEFFRDLPEPIIPKDLQPALLAVHSKNGVIFDTTSNLTNHVTNHTPITILWLNQLRVVTGNILFAPELPNLHDQITNIQRLIQILPVVNRDTLYLLLQFLGLVSENAEDKRADEGTIIPGNKMDATNLATLFAPNLLHIFSEDPSTFAKHLTATPSDSLLPTTNSSDHVSAMRVLIEKRDVIFELPSVDLHDVYLFLQEQFPEVLDALLRRRSALAGDEIPEDEEELEEKNGEGVKRGRRRTRREESIGSEFGSESTISSILKMKDRGDSSKGHLQFKVPRRKTSSSSEKRSIRSADVVPAVGETKGTDTIVYSPASTQPSNRATPSSDLFFGSGNTTPGYPLSPPAQSCCSSPPTFSPPVSPPPLHLVSTPTTSSSYARPRLAVNISSPSNEKHSARLSFGRAKLTEESKRGTISPTSPLSSPEHDQGKTSFLSVTPLSPPLGGRLGGTIKAHTDNLDHYINEIEKGDCEEIGSRPSSKQMKKYVRRRYTDTRHHTTELPDMRLEITKEASVRNPPVRKKVK